MTTFTIAHRTITAADIASVAKPVDDGKVITLQVTLTDGETICASWRYVRLHPSRGGKPYAWKDAQDAANQLYTQLQTALQTRQTAAA